MSDSRYSYDENSEVWPYFAVTLLGIVVVPSTVASIRNMMHKNKELSNDELKSQSASVEKFKNSRQKSTIFTASNIWIAAGWVLLMALLWLILQEREKKQVLEIFDPYEILDVSYTSTEKQIKSAYRKLSLLYHPDKVKDLGNVTAEFIEARYVDITKAYKALTDDEVRENYLRYGHPDGPRETSHGIALPHFLVNNSGSPFVIGIYTVVVGVLLPVMVGKWWSGSKSYTKTGIHQNTAAVFFELFAKEQPHFITHADLFQVLSEAEEYKILLPGLSSENIRQLMDSYLNRVESSDPKEEWDRYVVASRAVDLLSGMLDIASAFKSISLCRKIVTMQRSFVQAVPAKDDPTSELLQIPGSKISGKSQAAEIKLSDEATRYMRKLPQLHVLKAYFKVPGEEQVTPQSQSHLIVKYTILPRGVKLPKIDPERLLDETDTDNIPIEVLRDPVSTNKKGSVLPYALAPHFPGYVKSKWYGFLTSQRDDKIIDGPIELDRTTCWGNMHLPDEDLADESKVKISTFKIQMTVATPPVAGPFDIGLDLLSSTYFGTDVIDTIRMLVVDPPAETVKEAEQRLSDEKDLAEAEKEEEEDSEEEEDLTDIDTDTSDEEEEVEVEEDRKIK